LDEAIDHDDQHLFVIVKVITDDTFSQHEGFDLAFFDEGDWLPSDLPSFRVMKTEQYSAFKSRVAQHFQYAVKQIRLWVLVNRRNNTVRPITWVPEDEPSLSMSILYHFNFHASKAIPSGGCHP
jgi:ubiquitin carboxyl-terminal hydrolase 7